MKKTYQNILICNNVYKTPYGAKRQCIKFNEVDEGIDVNKSSASKECIILSLLVFFR